jgi:hypothetical protein
MRSSMGRRVLGLVYSSGAQYFQRASMSTQRSGPNHLLTEQWRTIHHALLISLLGIFIPTVPYMMIQLSLSK